MTRASRRCCGCCRSSSEGREDVPAEALKRDIYDAVVQGGVHARGDGPAVIIIEDLHWIDDASRELIEMAIANVEHAPVMLVISHRPDYMPLWRAQVMFTQINLHRLPQARHTAIIRAIGGGALPAALEELIWQRTEGNPFFTEEITRSLFDDGVLADHDGTIELARPLHEVPVPAHGARAARGPARSTRLEHQARGAGCGGARAAIRSTSARAPAGGGARSISIIT